MNSITARLLAYTHAIATFCAPTAAISCQVKRTAHPQESIEAGSGSVLPFGCLSSTAFTEARTQILIRNQELPGPGATLVGFEVHCQNAVMLDYTSLEVDVSSTNATKLSATFATNITGPVDPLLRRQNLRVFYNSAAWRPFHLQKNHVHDGASGLLIEVRKIVDPATAQFATMTATSSPVRSDLPAMVSSFGGPGSGASTAPTAQVTSPPLTMRLIWINAPTVRLLSDAAQSGNQFGLGGTVIHTVDGAPGALAASFFGDSFLSAPVSVSPVLGRLLVKGPIFDVAVLESSGRVQRRIAIPNNDSLVGMYLTYQSVTFDGSTGLIQFTNGIDHFINP